MIKVAITDPNQDPDGIDPLVRNLRRGLDYIFMESFSAGPDHPDHGRPLREAADDLLTRIFTVAGVDPIEHMLPSRGRSVVAGEVLRYIADDGPLTIYSDAPTEIIRNAFDGHPTIPNSDVTVYQLGGRWVNNRLVVGGEGRGDYNSRRYYRSFRWLVGSGFTTTGDRFSVEFPFRGRVILIPENVAEEITFGYARDFMVDAATLNLVLEREGTNRERSWYDAALWMVTSENFAVESTQYSDNVTIITKITPTMPDNLTNPLAVLQDEMVLQARSMAAWHQGAADQLSDYADRIDELEMPNCDCDDNPPPPPPPDALPQVTISDDACGQDHDAYAGANTAMVAAQRRGDIANFSFGGAGVDKSDTGTRNPARWYPNPALASVAVYNKAFENAFGSAGDAKQGSDTMFEQMNQHSELSLFMLEKMRAATPDAPYILYSGGCVRDQAYATAMLMAEGGGQKLQNGSVVQFIRALQIGSNGNWYRGANYLYDEGALAFLITNATASQSVILTPHTAQNGFRVSNEKYTWEAMMLWSTRGNAKVRRAWDLHTRYIRGQEHPSSFPEDVREYYWDGPSDRYHMGDAPHFLLAVACTDFTQTLDEGVYVLPELGPGEKLIRFPMYPTPVFHNNRLVNNARSSSIQRPIGVLNTQAMIEAQTIRRVIDTLR